jgi:aryl-alcohol dehydrogenase-like predicted oxidoreductase
MAGDRSVGWSGHDQNAARAALVAAYEHGITHWDTADVYGGGRAEALIGEVFEQVPRRDIFLATKIGWDAGPYDHLYHPEQIQRQLERSLALLRTDAIDLYYFHHCDFGPGDRYLDDALATMSGLQAQGKFRFLGLSDWDCRKLARLLTYVDPDVVQPYRNVVDDDYAASGLKALAESRNCGVAFFSPLRHGLLLGKYTEPVEFPAGDFRRNVQGFTDRALLERMQRNRQALERRFAAHPEPVLHALTGALLADAANACVLLGQRRPEQVAAAARLGDALDPADADWVRRLYG